MNALLKVERLTAWYEAERPVLRGLSFTLQPHEVVGLIGLNGSGKTTLIKVLSGLLSTFRADALTVHSAPLAVRDEAFKQQRYVVFAEDQAFQYFTFREYLAYVCAAYRIPVPDVEKLVEGFHFAAYTDTMLCALSTGNRKKVFLITAFALELPLLIFDEPVNGLDFQSTEFLYQQIKDYRAVGTVFFSSHVLESLALTADRVLVLADGSIARQFAPSTMEAQAIREALNHGQF